MDIIISNRRESDEVLLSTNIIENLHMPDYIVYEVCVKDNEIAFGPCIGILASNKDKSITKSSLRNYP